MSSRPPLSLRSILPNFMRRQPSLPVTQPPLPSPPPPPTPPARYIARPDTALPPTFDETWATVRNDAIWPHFIRTKKSKFELHAEDKMPGWFLRLESHEDSASEVLWPNVIRLERDSDYSVKHWSLRFLRYALVERADRPALPSAFASMIVFEVIFTVLTPYPEEWPGGIDAISELTRSRRDFESRSPENLDLDEQMRTITYRSPEAEGLFSDQRIRKDAFEYLERHGKMETLLYEEGAFFSVLIHDLRHMAKRRRKGRRFFPHVSFLSDHDIVFGG
ncbi:hypothetical protein CPB85DRAFT_1255127 [Mucidula mucida]|nr:hypothetical protein CPB85DRAFT_1255127 [Mucidula mucida]